MEEKKEKTREVLDLRSAEEGFELIEGRWVSK